MKFVHWFIMSNFFEKPLCYKLFPSNIIKDNTYLSRKAIIYDLFDNPTSFSYEDQEFN